jgi:hypothetical protein
LLTDLVAPRCLSHGHRSLFAVPTAFAGSPHFIQGAFEFLATTTR